MVKKLKKEDKKETNKEMLETSIKSFLSSMETHHIRDKIFSEEYLYNIINTIKKMKKKQGLTIEEEKKELSKTIRFLSDELQDKNNIIVIEALEYLLQFFVHDALLEAETDYSSTL